MDLNQFYNYADHILRPQYKKSGDLEVKNIGSKYKDNIKFILRNYLSNWKWNQTTNTIKKFDPPLPWKSDNGTMMQ